MFRQARSGELSRKLPNTSLSQPMSKSFYKHKLLLDEHLPPRQFLPRLNEHFDVKHIKHDLRHAGMEDPLIHELAVEQGRIIFTSNINDFRTLIQEDSPGVIGIPVTWSTSRLDTTLTPLCMHNGPNYFRGHYRSLAVPDIEKQAA